MKELGQVEIRVTLIMMEKVKKRRKVKRPKKEVEEGAVKPENKEKKTVRIIENEEEALAYKKENELASDE